MMAWLRISLTVTILLLLTLVFLPVQLITIGGRSRLASLLPVVWHRAACFLVGIRVQTVGERASGRPLLIAANHQSWSDILVLGSVMPLSFIAKAEVRGWPVFGILARLQRTVFVEREARRKTGEQASEIANRLTGGDVMVLFAEGTTSDGNEVLPFKTALFGAAQAALKASGASCVIVQPVALAYTRANGLPLGRYFRPLAAWPGDVELAPHLLQVLREGALDVEVSFGEPIVFEPQSDRKRVAALAEMRTRHMLARSLRGGEPSASNIAEDASASTVPLAKRHDAVDIEV